MIDKKTRNKIVILLLKRRYKLDHRKTSALELYSDFNWLMLHSGQILDELEGEGVIGDKK